MGRVPVPLSGRTLSLPGDPVLGGATGRTARSPETGRCHPRGSRGMGVAP